MVTRRALMIEPLRSFCPSTGCSRSLVGEEAFIVARRSARLHADAVVEPAEVESVALARVAGLSTAAREHLVHVADGAAVADDQVLAERAVKQCPCSPCGRR